MIDHLRYALRQAQKNPGFAALAILTLALGIGANTAMFTVIDSVLLRPLPYRDADRLVIVSNGPASAGNSVQSTSLPNFLDIREQAHSLRTAAAYMLDVPVVRTGESTQAVPVVKVTGDLFDVLGIQPRIGRAFTEADNQAGAPLTALLTSGFWREHFASDPNVVGKVIHIGAVPYTVIGVLPEGLRFPGDEADVASGLWLPYQREPDAMKERGSNFLTIIACLRPGVSREAAQSELTTIARGIVAANPDQKDLSFHLVPYREVLTSQIRPVFLALMGALLLVLLIACANVANLLLARCLARANELALRTALGARRRDLLVQMLSEGAVLAMFGSIAGLALAQLMLAGLHRLPPDMIPRASEIQLRLPVFLALLATAAVVTVLSAIVPALVAMKSDPHSVMQEGSRSSSGGLRRSRLSGALVATEVALSVILLIASGLMFRTLYRLQHNYLGIDEHNVTRFMALPGNAAGFFSGKGLTGHESQANSLAERVYFPLLEKLKHLPGVEDAAFANAAPFQGINLNSSVAIVGREKKPGERIGAQMRAITGGYPRAIGTPVVRGRMFTDVDGPEQPFVAAVNEQFARKYFPGQDALGQRLSFGGAETGMVQPYTIVAVLADSVQTNIAQPVLPEVYFPIRQIPINSFYYQLLVAPETTFVLRTRAGVDVAPSVRGLFRQDLPDFAIDDVTTMKAAHENADINQRVGMYLIGSFAGIAIVMVLAGLYGVLSQIVGQRRREIGVRMALGADRQTILALVLRRGLVLIACGVLVGIPASMALARYLRSFFYGVSPLDPWTYIAVTVALAIIGAMASLLPARRAAGIEPGEALRAE